jgi:hypothetical protein
MDVKDVVELCKAAYTLGHLDNSLGKEKEEGLQHYLKMCWGAEYG